MTHPFKTVLTAETFISQGFQIVLQQSKSGTNMGNLSSSPYQTGTARWRSVPKAETPVSSCHMTVGQECLIVLLNIFFINLRMTGGLAECSWEDLG